MAGFLIADFRCDSCGHSFDEMVDRDERPESLECPCGEQAPRVPSCPKVRFSRGVVVNRGKNDPVPPGAVSTEALADGMPYAEWKKKQMDPVKSARRRAAGIDPKVWV